MDGIIFVDLLSLSSRTSVWCRSQDHTSTVKTRTHTRLRKNLTHTDTHTLSRINKKRLKENSEADKPADSAMTREAETDDDAEDTDDYTSWISTHPPTKKRIAFFEKSRVDTTPELLNSSEWAALQAICGKPKPEKKDAKSPAQKGGTGK